MEKLPYLKDQLQTNIPLVVRIVKRVGQYPETDYNTKEPTGRMQTLYNFALPNGQTVRHYAKEHEEETLQVFQAGESLQVVRQESTKYEKRTYFLVWTPVGGAEARLAANPPLNSNVRQTATKRELEERESERELKDISICLQGFAQAFIIQGQKAGEAIELAVVAREALLKKSRELQLGFTPPVSSVSIEEVDNVFGQDISPTL